jgi:hypothetical protein
VYGEEGNDILSGGAGLDDYCSGGSGTETVPLADCEIFAGVP